MQVGDIESTALVSIGNRPKKVSTIVARKSTRF